MKYGIFGCIHANLPALQGVLRDAEGQGCTHLACLGDIVGYGFQPKECVDLVRSLNIPCVKGNHDEYVSSDEPLDGFNPDAAERVRWTRAQLREEDREWLRNLKLVEQVDGFTITHATMEQPAKWGYVFDKLAAAASFQAQRTSLCFFAHTHVPVAFMRDTMVRGGTFAKFKIEPRKEYFVNVGSVGQPRDGNPKAAYVVYDSDEGTIELRRVAFSSNGTPPAAPAEILVR